MGKIYWWLGYLIMRWFKEYPPPFVSTAAAFPLPLAGCFSASGHCVGWDVAAPFCLARIPASCSQWRPGSCRTDHRDANAWRIGPTIWSTEYPAYFPAKAAATQARIPAVVAGLHPCLYRDSKSPSVRWQSIRGRRSNPYPPPTRSVNDHRKRHQTAFPWHA